MSFPFYIHSAAVSDSHHGVLFKATTQHGRLSTAVLCCGLEKNGMVGAWHGHDMASVNQTRPHCVNQMGKTHSKPLAARHGRGMGTACYVWIDLKELPSFRKSVVSSASESKSSELLYHENNETPVNIYQSRGRNLMVVVNVPTSYSKAVKSLGKL